MYIIIMIGGKKQVDATGFFLRLLAFLAFPSPFVFNVVLLLIGSVHFRNALFALWLNYSQL